MALAKQFRLTGYHLLKNRRKKNFDFGLFPGGMAVAECSIDQLLKWNSEKEFSTSSVTEHESKSEKLND